MATLVLDKSALRAAPLQFLRNMRGRHGLLLTETLLYELGTEDMDSWDSMAASERQALDSRIQGLFNKAIAVAGNEWVDQALEWEITKGRSARSKPRIPAAINLEQIRDPSVVRLCLALDNGGARFASFDVPIRNQNDLDVFAGIRKMPDSDLFNCISDLLTSDSFPAQVRESIYELVRECEQRCRLTMFECFAPSKEWYIYGLALAHMVYVWWKMWRYGSDVPSNPTNWAYDLDYIAYMAIADGLLSSDKKMLTLAWAAWPDKRQDLFEYRDEKILTFAPSW